MNLRVNHVRRQHRFFRDPKKIICDQRQKVVGLWLIRPVLSEGYEDGYNRWIDDVYKAAIAISVSADGIVWRRHRYWRFHKRIRKFVKPVHRDFNGKPYRCEQCEAFWAKNPNPQDEILISEEAA